MFRLYMLIMIMKLKATSNTAGFGVQPSKDRRLGRGHVVLFAGDPNFRLFWRGTTQLFLNAVLLLSTY